MPELRIDCERPTSLLWWRDALYDVATGWQRLWPDPAASLRPSFGDFDAAQLAPDGSLAALSDTDGTRALILEPGGGVLRELTRDRYHAWAFRYPLCLFTLPDGRTGLAHCPERYHDLSIEVASTGEVLWRQDGFDYFHSRLQVNGEGVLVAGGWVWTPWNMVRLFDLAGAASGQVDELDDPDISGEPEGVCWLGPDLVVATNEDEPLDDGEFLPPLTLARWSRTQGWRWRVPIEGPLADLLPFGDDILALGGHPQLYDGATGALIAEWPDEPTGKTYGPILFGGTWTTTSRVAVDPGRRRFAVAGEDHVTVVTRE